MAVLKFKQMHMRHILKRKIFTVFKRNVIKISEKYNFYRLHKVVFLHLLIFTLHKLCKNLKRIKLMINKLLNYMLYPICSFIRFAHRISDLLNGQIGRPICHPTNWIFDLLGRFLDTGIHFNFAKSSKKLI